MHIKKSQSKQIENSKNCTIWEYEFPSKDFSFATALINGRYPDEKSTCNFECQETYYVISGSGTVNSEKGCFKISQGDLYFFEKGEKFWVEGEQLFVALVNAPKWTPEQHKIVD